MKQYNIIEGSSGVLELVAMNGDIEIYRPDCDLDKTKLLLHKFYKLKTSNGLSVKESYYINNLNWFPTAVGTLYWHYFYQFVKYQSIIEKITSGEIEVLECSPGRFKNFMELTYWRPNSSRVKKILTQAYHLIIQTRNRIVTKKSGDILFFQYEPNDFRTSELCDALKANFSVVKICNIRLNKVLHHFFDTKIYIYVSPYPNIYMDVELSDSSNFLFNSAIKYTNQIINKHVTSYYSHTKLFEHLNYSFFIGIDDTTTVYPLLYASSDNSINSLGIQHGIYVSRHEDYIMNGIQNYKWFDNVIVWGEYWKRLIQKHSNLFDDSFHLVASNKHSYEYKQPAPQGDKRVVLIPYEFLADTIIIGEYIKKFIDQGFDVHFKIRPGPGESIKAQLHAYFLGSYLEKITIIEEISYDQMSCVSAIAGTQTTLLLDLLPFQKPIFILDTPFNFMLDIVEDGLARLVSMDEMESINDIYNKAVTDNCHIDYLDIFGTESIDNLIYNYIHSNERFK